MGACEGGAISGFDCILQGFVQASHKYIKVYFICCLHKRKLLGIVIVGFNEMGQLLIIYSGFVRYLRKEGNTMRQCIEFKEAYDSVRWEVLYNILIEFGIPMKR